MHALIKAKGLNSWVHDSYHSYISGYKQKKRVNTNPRRSAVFKKLKPAPLVPTFMPWLKLQ